MSIDTQRLARILGMLGSSYEGEVANAARAATRILNDAGLTWAEAAERIATPVKTVVEKVYTEAPKATRTQRTYEPKRARPSGRTQEHRGIKARELIAFLQADNMQRRMTPWERDFIASLVVQSSANTWGYSEAQWRVLWEIGIKCGAFEDEPA